MYLKLSHWLAMGGYGAYVWPAYGVAIVIIGCLALVSVLSARAARRELQRLQTASHGAGDRAP